MTATASPVAAGGRLYEPRLRAMTAGIVALVSLLAFEALAVGTAMPTVARSLDGLGGYALAFGGPFASGVVGMVASGLWCDARGPRAAMWSGLACFVAGLLLAGAATTMGTPGPAGYAATLAVAAGCALVGVLLAGRVVPA
ncbi:hypothetical protein [Micromonospora mirobrigensis]|uniref:Major Facilitator Superfamily protein n=1 Tax=Micromonospora mirobrigensis TaxID=262898 RepID=A0A1C5AEX5_9ACTN|nr:hypothetical protein GA0070564_109154 [Micromonospora mirobrigensis]